MFRSQLTIIVISIQFHHFLIKDTALSGRILDLTFLQILKPKGSLADATPRVMLDPPTLCIRKGLSPSPVWFCKSSISSKVGTNELVSAVNVELA